jgi:hypothetical protein
MLKIFSDRFKQSYLIGSVFFLLAGLVIVLHFLFHPVRVLGMNTSIFYMDEKHTLAAFFVSTVAFLVGYLSLEKALFLSSAKLQKKNYRSWLWFVFCCPGGR